MTRRECVERDAGFTLLETVVSMTLMAIFGVIFTGAVVMMTSSSTKSESLTVVSGQVDRAFQFLDRDVRYASGITPPGKGSDGDWYVEYLNGPGTSCVQLRVDAASQQLQRRTASVTGGAVGSAGAWSTIATGVSGSPAFSLSNDASLAYKQLTVNLTSRSATAGRTTSAGSTMTFTALNSALNNQVCAQVVRQ